MSLVAAPRKSAAEWHGRSQRRFYEPPPRIKDANVKSNGFRYELHGSDGFGTVRLGEIQAG